MEDFWSGKTILVTGAGGFIASHLVEALAARHAKVRAFVRYNSRGDPGLLRLLDARDRSRIEIIPGDLRDLPAVQQAMQGASHVFHLGALISIPYSYLHPMEVVETNVIGTLNVLLAARQTGIQRLVHTSSSEVYGSALHTPIGEDHPLQGQSPYSASKIGADKLVESFHLSYGLPAVTLRPFNTYGPRQSGRAIVPTIITQALTGQQVRLGNLETRRDLTYISDTVAGFLSAGEAASVEGLTINLGAGIEFKIGELAEKIIGIIGRKVEIVLDPERMRPERSEVQRLVSDNRLAKDILGWQPQIGVEEGLRQTIAWIEAHLDFYRIGQYEI